MPHFVDDNSLIGPSVAEVDRVGDSLTVFLDDLGVPFKALKSSKGLKDISTLGVI